MKSIRWNLSYGAITVLFISSIGSACFQPGERIESSSLLHVIKAKAAKVREQLIDIRRQIHMNPELSGEEEKTAELVANRLRKLGLEVETGVGGHGVVGVLKGARAEPVVAYRADMDAVRSPVVGDPPYKSRVDGVKHVCGHDAHVAVALGIAEVLASIREDLPGTVKFIFQPAEENVLGARAMIKDGALEDPSPEAIFAVHTTPLPVGFIGCPLGVGLTGWDVFEIRLEATDGLEEVERDILGSLEALSTVAQPTSPEEFSSMMDGLSMKEGPLKDFVYIQIAEKRTLSDGSNARIITGRVGAAGPKTYARARQELDEALKTATEGKARFELTFGDERFPDMHSDPRLVQAAIGPIEAAIGEGKTLLIHSSIPFFGEDFALFQQRISGAMFFLGVANEEKGIPAFNHFPDYDIDESAIEVGTVAMANVLLTYLKTH